ncbi:MAG: hypothetical protein ACREMZ_01630 [Gemmatimonadales bacterium]
MTGVSRLLFPRASLRVVAGGLLLIIATACSGDGVGPSVEAALPADSTAVPGDTTATPGDTTVATPGDSTIAPGDSTTTPGQPPVDSTGMSPTAVPVLDTRSGLPGIVFAPDNMETEFLSSALTGTKRGGGLTPTNILPLLADVRARGGRIVLKLCLGRDSYVKNPDGTFSLTKWKSLVSRFKSVNLDPYIADGTIVGHFLIDEPHRTAKWGGKIISHATLETMAQYSKELWPTLHTFTHTQMGWLASTPITFKHLDAGWTQYTSGKGDVAKWAATEISYARSKRLGLVLGMNITSGGNGSSGIRGSSSRYYSMSATELRSYGTVLLDQSYACAFFMWQHNTTYFGRSDIKSAMTELSLKARGHAKTSCNQ